MTMLVLAYRPIGEAALAKGFDPDHPLHPGKVTRTL